MLPTARYVFCVLFYGLIVQCAARYLCVALCAHCCVLLIILDILCSLLYMLLDILCICMLLYKLNAVSVAQ